MNKFYNKTMMQKMILALTLVVILFNFIMPTYSQAAFDWGGTLFTPIRKLICGLGDAVINFLQSTFIKGSVKAIDYRSQAQIDAKGTVFEGLNDVVSGLMTFTNNHPFLSSIGGMNISSVLLAYGTGKPQGLSLSDFVKKPFPLIQYSPAAIFANKIPVFDVNFINPSDTTADSKDIKNTSDILQKKAKEILANKNATSSEKGWVNDVEEQLKKIEDTNGKTEEEAKKIIEKNVKILNNLIEEAESKGINTSINSYLTTSQSTASVLRSTISKWYTNLRNIAIVGLLSVLIYIGIRILLCSASQEKAKYKNMLKDWLVGMFLVFFMHYIMAFTMNLMQILIDIFSKNILTNLGYDIVINDIRTIVLADDNGVMMAGTLMYAVMIFYTIMFTWRYLKRTVYMAFLTMIAPLVAFTYPIDKINDGSAQAFNMWFKEYFFNAILQPVHLLLYTILVTSAMTLVVENPIYALVAIGFIGQAEKIIRKMFGFNKAEGGGLASGVAGAALFSTGLGLLQKGASHVGNHSSKGSGKSGSGDNSKPHFYKTPESDSAKDLKAFSSGNPDGIASGPAVATLGGGSIGTNGSGNGFKSYSNANRPRVASKSPSIGTAKFNRNPSIKSASAKFRQGSMFSGAAKTTNRPTKKQKKISGVKRVLGGTGRVAKKYVLNKDFAKKAGRAVIKGYAAATLGTIGVAAGLASDDFENVFKMGGAGIAGGMVVGGAISNLASGAVNVKDTFQEGYYTPEEYREKQNEKAIKQYMKDENTERHYRNEYGSAYKEKMKTAKELIEHGVTDQKDIDSAIKLMDKNDGLSVREAASVMQFKNKITQDQLMDAEKRANVQNYVHSLTGNKEGTQRVMNLVDQVYNVRTAPRQQTRQQPSQQPTQQSRQQPRQQQQPQTQSGRTTSRTTSKKSSGKKKGKK